MKANGTEKQRMPCVKYRSNVSFQPRRQEAPCKLEKKASESGMSSGLEGQESWFPREKHIPGPGTSTDRRANKENTKHVLRTVSGPARPRQHEGVGTTREELGERCGAALVGQWKHPARQGAALIASVTEGSPDIQQMSCKSGFLSSCGVF